MEQQEAGLGQQKKQQHDHSDVVLLLFDFVLGLQVVGELDLELVLVLYEVELDIFNLLALNDLPELLQEVHLSSLRLHLPHKCADGSDLPLEVFFLELEKGLQGLLVGRFAYTQQEQQEGIGRRAQRQEDQFEEEAAADAAHFAAPDLQGFVELPVEL